MEAIFEGLLLRGSTSTAEEYLPGFEAFIKPQKDDLFHQWEAATDREKRSRTMFAQETIKVEDVARELTAIRSAIGSRIDVAAFTKEGLRAHRAVVSENGAVRFTLTDVPRALREAIGNESQLIARFELSVKDGQVYLSRTHPVVEGLASYVMDTALDAVEPGVARRCGVIRTNAVQRRTTVLLLRCRYHIITQRGTRHRHCSLKIALYRRLPVRPRMHNGLRRSRQKPSCMPVQKPMCCQTRPPIFCGRSSTASRPCGQQ